MERKGIDHEKPQGCGAGGEGDPGWGSWHLCANGFCVSPEGSSRSCYPKEKKSLLSLATQSVVHGQAAVPVLTGSLQDMNLSPTPDLVNQTLTFNKVPDNSCAH